MATKGENTQKSTLTSGVPKLLHLSAADRRRISDLKYAKTVDEVEEFKTWIMALPDPDGTLKRWWTHKTMHNWLLPGFVQCLSRIPLERWNSMDATTNLGEAQHAWNNAQTGISMGVIESFKKYEELDARRAAEIEMRMATAISRNSYNEVSQRYANRTARQSRGFEKGRRARATDANVAALETELLELKEELETARADEDTEQSAIRDLVAGVVDIEGRLKLAKAEAKSNSSGRVRAPKTRKANSTPTASKLTTELTPGASTSTVPSGLSPSAVVVVSDARRVSSRKRTQPDSSAVTSSKRQKKLEDPLAGWVMQDPDTGETLTGHEWVERNPEEFAKRYKKDHKRYLDYLGAKSGD
ncbi:hypothetical protein C8R47DRAFT_1062509 [Mycena vitilis]|nr:hypothetical protein C8R47DRAFT_1062509 [Mycena vitilis]